MSEQRITLTHYLASNPLTMDVATITNVLPSEVAGAEVELGGAPDADGRAPSPRYLLVKESVDRVRDLIERARG